MYVKPTDSPENRPKLSRTERFKKDFKRLDRLMQDRVLTSIEKFLINSRHPALHVKKMEGTSDIWEFRVSDNYRITFRWVGGEVILRRVGTHGILGNP